MEQAVHEQLYVQCINLDLGTSTIVGGYFEKP